MTPLKIVDGILKPFIEKTAIQIRLSTHSTGESMPTNLTPEIYYRSVEVIFTKIEGVATLVGFIPEASFVSGAVRTVMGLVEAISFAVLAAFHWIRSQITDSPTLRDNFKLYASYEADLIYHGLGNIVRGIVEMLPPIGNWISIGYSLAGERMQYQFEIREAEAEEEQGKAQSRNPQGAS